MDWMRRRVALNYLIGLALFVLGFFINIIFIGTFIVFIILFTRGTIKFIKYRAMFKKEVVGKVVHLINPFYQYSANKHISLNDFNQSKIISKPASACKGDDYVTGIIDKTQFEFSELKALHEYQATGSDSRTEKKYETLFNGIFFMADFNKHIQGETYVIPDNAERLLGKFGQNLQRSWLGELVKLENPDFEKHFAVFATSQTEARYVLTPTMMEAIVNLKEKIGRNFSLSFTGERVYCGVVFNRGLFEPALFRSVRYGDVEFMHTLFTLIEVIITEMNLNTRIWTKE
jgi:hypothetical protein